MGKAKLHIMIRTYCGVYFWFLLTSGSTLLFCNILPGVIETSIAMEVSSRWWFSFSSAAAAVADSLHCSCNAIRNVWVIVPTIDLAFMHFRSETFFYANATANGVSIHRSRMLLYFFRCYFENKNRREKSWIIQELIINHIFSVSVALALSFVKHHLLIGVKVDFTWTLNAV